MLDSSRSAPSDNYTVDVRRELPHLKMKGAMYEYVRYDIHPIKD